jgi:DNA-directed RNA polymerase specialized sigma subunit
MVTWANREAVPSELQLLTDYPAPQSSESNWETIVAELPERLRVVVERYYVSGNTFRHIAKDLGVCQARARQLRDKAIRLLREKVTA